VPALLLVVGTTQATSSADPGHHAMTTSGSAAMPGMDHGAAPGTDPGTMPGMDHGATPGTDPGTMPGMDHGAAPATDHATMPGMDHGTAPATDPGTGAGTAPGAHGDGHSGAGDHGSNVLVTDADRPAGLLIGGFLAVNVLLILLAAVLRRRGPAVRRRMAMARVREAASDTAPLS
jgi:uncharacterized protein involved in copper resistance